jgi:hypothetical protein
MQNEIFSASIHQHRLKTLLRYYETMENSDVETVALLLQEAESDPVLEKMLLEVNATYIEQPTVAPNEIMVIHELVNRYLTTSGLQSQEGPLQEHVPASTEETLWQGNTSIKHFMLHFWLVLTKQIPLIPRSIWLVNLFVLGMSGILAFYMTFISPKFFYGATLELALVTSVASAGSLVYLFSTKTEASQEIILSTPTSQALILLSRFVILVGYNIGLSFLLTLLFAFTHGVNPLEIAQVWVGPVLLLSSISLALTVVLGSLSTLLGILLLEGLQILQTQFSGATMYVAHNFLWQTNMTVFLLACGFTAFAYIYCARYPRLPNDMAL